MTGTGSSLDNITLEFTSFNHCKIKTLYEGWSRITRNLIINRIIIMLSSLSLYGGKDQCLDYTILKSKNILTVHFMASLQWNL